MKKKYDIFISYRRDGGFEMAKLLSEKLTQKGYTVFFDVDVMKGGAFNEQIYEKIASCKNLILVLSKGALDKCANENDWVRKEVSYALSLKKLVVPVLLADFTFPAEESLPQELRPLIYCQALCPDKALFDESINKLCSMYLSVKPHRIKVILLSTAVVLITFILVLFLQMNNGEQNDFSNLDLGWKAHFSESWQSRLGSKEVERNLKLLDSGLSTDGMILNMVSNDNSMNINIMKHVYGIREAIKFENEIDGVLDEIMGELSNQFEELGYIVYSVEKEMCTVAGKEYDGILMKYQIGDGIPSYWPAGTLAFCRNIIYVNNGVSYIISVTSFEEDNTMYVLKNFRPID